MRCPRCARRHACASCGPATVRSALRSRRACRALGLKNVMFQPYQPRERLRESLSLPDIHIVSLDERLEGLIVPSKFVGVLATGRPVLWIGRCRGRSGQPDARVRLWGDGAFGGCRRLGSGRTRTE